MSTVTAPAVAPVAADSKPARWGQIEGLRALAATLVFTGHAWNKFGGPDERMRHHVGHTLNSFSSVFTWQMGATGVALFYAISGFVLYQPFVRARAEGRQLNLGAYAVRRAARIIPAYWAALIIVGLATHSTALFTPRGFLDYFCFFQLFSELDFGPMSADSISVIVNNPLPVAWTLCVEVSFYIVLPVFAALVAKVTERASRPVRSELLLIGGMVAVSLAYKAGFLIVTAHDSLSMYTGWLAILPFSIDIFCVGMLIAVLAQRAPAKGWPAPLEVIARHPGRACIAAIVAFVATVSAGASWVVDPANWIFHVNDNVLIHIFWGFWAVLNAVIAMLLLLPAVAAADRPSLMRSILSNRIVMWIGLVSYGLYLWHDFVQQQINALFEGGRTPYWFIPIAMPVAYGVTLGIAAISWYALEKRVMQPTKRLPMYRD